MIRGFYSAAAGLASRQAQLNVIANNMANVNTTGFKASSVYYADSFSNMLSTAASSSASLGSPASSMQIGTGTQVAQVSANNTQGSISATGVATNLAINGEGYFVLRDSLDSSTYVTRAGNFTLDDSGNLLSASGHRVQGLTGGNITYAVSQDASGNLTYAPTITDVSDVTPEVAGDINLDFSLSVGNGLTPDSSVTATDAEVNAGAPQLSSIGFDSNGNAVFYMNDGNSYASAQVLLMNFQNPNALTKQGDNLYSNLSAAGPNGGTLSLSSTNNKPGTNNLGTFKTESLELSNVDLTQEFANLITTQRSFQAGSRIITVSDDILQEVVNLKR